MDEKEFDIVVDALYQRIDSLWNMTDSNIKMGMFSEMDYIRMSQIDQLKAAVAMWENK